MAFQDVTFDISELILGTVIRKSALRFKSVMSKSSHSQAIKRVQ